MLIAILRKILILRLVQKLNLKKLITDVYPLEIDDEIK
jgi:hypothetical protein